MFKKIKIKKMISSAQSYLHGMMSKHLMKKAQIGSDIPATPVEYHTVPEETFFDIINNEGDTITCI